MTKQRMDDLLEALQNEGWRLLSQHEHLNASSDPFKLEDSSLLWAISRADDPTVVIELEFLAYGPLGHYGNELRDIFFCRVIGRDERLYFSKRNKPEWRTDLERFVRYVSETRAEHPVAVKRSDDLPPEAGRRRRGRTGGKR